MNENIKKSNGNGVWKTIAIVLMGVVVTGVSSYLTFGNDGWRSDRGVVISHIHDNTTEKIDAKVMKSVEPLRTEISYMRRDIERNSKKLDILLGFAKSENNMR